MFNKSLNTRAFPFSLRKRAIVSYTIISLNKHAQPCHRLPSSKQLSLYVRSAAVYASSSSPAGAPGSVRVSKISWTSIPGFIHGQWGFFSQFYGIWRAVLVVGSLLCSERFFSRCSDFPLSSKTNII